jgi:hypothetical protein
MRAFFRGWRRKVGAVTLFIACVLSVGWARNSATDDAAWIIFADSSGFRILSGSGTIQVTRYWPVEITGWVPPSNDFGWSVSKKTPAPVTTTIGLRRSARWVQIAPVWVPNRSAEQDMLDMWVRYWAIVLPLTLLSAWLLISKPRMQNQDLVKPTATDGA